MNGNVCESYDPDEKFRRLKIVEFPCVFVGLQSSIIVTLEDDLNSAVYLRTNSKGQLMSFDDAQKVSPSHRAFDMKIIDNYRINITFKPTSECVSWAKVLCKNEEIKNTFIYDIRIIKMDGRYCCRNESHYEVSRYYICGQFEYCNISHTPQVLRFGDVPVKTRVTKIVEITNESSVNSFQMEYIKSFALEAVPRRFTLGPISTKKISVTVKPTSWNTPQFVCFLIRNKHSNKEEEPSNFLTYKIKVNLKVIIKSTYRDVFVESLHKLYEKNQEYTYCDEEIFEHEKQKAIAMNMLDISKSRAQRPHIDESNISCDSRNKIKCVSSILSEPIAVFCEEVKVLISNYDMINIFILPVIVDFGLVAIDTIGSSDMIITNDTNFNISVKFVGDSMIFFSVIDIKTKIIAIEPFQSIKVNIFLSGLGEGTYEGNFYYSINDVISRAHAYKANVCSPMLLIEERFLKFGMVTNDMFVTSAQVRLKNSFNIPIKFRWDYTTDEAIFAVTPECSWIPKHCTRICDVTYLCKLYKAKTYHINLFIMNDPLISTQIEVIFVSRKHQVKFSEQTINLKDVPLNLKTTKRITMQNLSKEIAFFNVVDMQMPGLKISPLSGMMSPKSIANMTIEARLCCVMSFQTEIQIKINNENTITLPINGNVVEPKIVIHPKQIIMPRIPSYMINYTQVTIQNIGSIRSMINVINNDSFKVFIGNEFNTLKETFFYIEAGQSKTLYIQIYHESRRQYNDYIPVQINELLGPPNKDPKSTEFQYYTKPHETAWAVLPKVKVKPINSDISYCRISGIITMPLVEFSLDSFEIYYNSENDNNTLEFTLTNVSNNTLPITIILSNLAPFSLNYKEEFDKDYNIEIGDEIKVNLNKNNIIFFQLQFNPTSRGEYTSTAVLFLDEHMETPYNNLTFYGRHKTPVMIPSVYQVIFPPCGIGVPKIKILFLKTEGNVDISTFSVNFGNEKNVSVEFVEAEASQDGGAFFTIVRVKILVSCETIHSALIYLCFYNENGAECDVELSFNVTNCPITLHNSGLISSEQTPYPFYPTVEHNDLYQYMEDCVEFLEEWLFQEGFKKELYPEIPNTFHITSNNLSSSLAVSSSPKNIKVTFMNFLRRIVGPLINDIKKEKVAAAASANKSYKEVLKLYNTYQEITSLLQIRGCKLWTCQAMFLLSYDQFVLYTQNVKPASTNESMLYQTLSSDEDLYNRLTKQCWLDLILQFYKEFIFECCYIDNTGVSKEEHQKEDIVGIIIKWYNAQIDEQHHNERKNDKRKKVVTNLTGDLSDCIAITSAIINYCPFLKDHFSLFCEVDQGDADGSIITNACLIIEALNILKISFPLKCTHFLKPNLLRMLFLSVHLYVVLPMFKPRDTVEFHPPLLKSSQRSIAVFAAQQENFIYNFTIVNDPHNSFAAEKAAAAGNSKKQFVKVKYTANFVKEQKATLLVHGYNKTRLFDTFAVFELKGVAGTLSPLKKCTLHGQLYRPSKASLTISSPFQHSGPFKISIINDEPKVPVNLETVPKPKFHVHRLNLVEEEINLAGSSGKGGKDAHEEKVEFEIVCMSVQTECAWIWFTSEVGEFFISVATECRWDVPTGSLLAPVQPAEPCQGDSCHCSQETVIMLPHLNEILTEAVRYALQQNGSDTMMNVFDDLIESNTGLIVLGELFEESGTNMHEVDHILRKEKRYQVSGTGLRPHSPIITLKQHSLDILALPVVVTTDTATDKYSITLTSECGFDIRTYNIILTALTQTGE